jgi:drug/metabolite transporter (DMT)-like permease
VPRSHRLIATGTTLLAMVAFAGNSILCRLALVSGAIDPASFTGIRLASGAIALALIVGANRRNFSVLSRGSWFAASMLFLYAVLFSYAYVELAAATGALILFGFVQGTMICVALYRGERPQRIEILGWLMAVAGLVALLLPGARSPPGLAALMMASAGIAWGVYSILGMKKGDPLAATAANFLRSALFVLLLVAMTAGSSSFSLYGVVLAVCSGVLTSGLGYVIWYVALNHLTSLQAALVQLSVPAIAAAGGVTLLSETLTLQFLHSGTAILGGVLIALVGKTRTSHMQ